MTHRRYQGLIQRPRQGGGRLTSAHAKLETAFDLVSAAGARALGIADYGIAVGGAATLFAISASGIPEAVAAHPPRKVVLFGGRLVARDGVVLPVPAPIG